MGKIDKMKILWFSNTPANSDAYFNKELKGSGGWLKALDQAMQNEVDLHVAFYHPVARKPFTYKNTTYYPIKRADTPWAKALNRILGRIIDREDEAVYLRLIEDIRPDIIHIHGTENPFGCIIGKTVVPVVVSIQGNLTVYHHKYFSGLEKKYLSVQVRKRTNIWTTLFSSSFKDQFKRFEKMQKREERNLHNCKYVIGRTDWDRRITRILAPQSEYFHNDEILRDSFYTQKWQWTEQSSFILHTTNSNTYYKGFETLCHALTLLHSTGLDVTWKVAGIAENDLIVKIVKKKLKDKYPRKGLRLLGRIPEKELINELLSSHIYVMASHIENSPNNVCEAMLLGMPSIATYAGGTGSLINDGINGVLIQDGDPWSMAGAVLELVKDKKKAEFLGKQAREKAIYRHNREKIIAELIAIYKKIITLSQNEITGF